ncbi:MAG: hypothetical protein Q9166_006670 [cf. Caloplaca sp. 2 TL-2023]
MDSDNRSGGLDNCQFIWTDGDLEGRSRNFSVSRNESAEPQKYGYQPQYYAPELKGGHQFTYPKYPESQFVTVNAQDNITVSWTQGGSAQATVLGIECWSRSADPVIQSNGPSAIDGPITTVNATEFTVPMSEYINFNPCRFTLKNSIPDDYLQVSQLVYISNVTAGGSENWSVNHTAPVNLTSPSQRASGAGTIGGSATVKFCNLRGTGTGTHASWGAKRIA